MCPCMRVVCVDVQVFLNLVLSTKTHFESTSNKEVGRMSSTNQEIMFCVPCSVSCEIVARELCLRCRGGGGVQEPSPAAAAPPAPRWGHTGVAFIFFFFPI